MPSNKTCLLHVSYFLFLIEKKMPNLPGDVIIGNGLNNTENIQCVGVEAGISQTILVVYKL